MVEGTIMFDVYDRIIAKLIFILTVIDIIVSIGCHTVNWHIAYNNDNLKIVLESKIFYHFMV